MSRVVQRDTAPELGLRSALHRRGLRFRVDRPPMPGIRSRADVVFGPARVAVYIDGCFWHGCPLHGSVPSSNANFWKRKFEENRRRDAETKAKLEQRGWVVLRFWEHDDPGIAAEQGAPARSLPERKSRPAGARDAAVGEHRSMAVRPSPAQDQIRVADFFCGCGGTSAGLRAAGMRIGFGLDFEKDAGNTFRANFPEAEFLQKDISDAHPSEVESLLGTEPNPLLISACAPCQPYSSFVGTRRKDARRALLLRLVPFIRLLEPTFIFIENVPGMRAIHANAGTFARFRKALRELKFAVTTAVVDCRDYGIPQRRRRLIVLASRLGPISIPEPTHGGTDRPPYVTVWESIGDLPPIDAGDVHPQVANHHASDLSPLNLRRIRATPPGGSRFDWPEELWLDCHKDGHRGHPDVYGRMNPDAPAPSLTTKCTSISNGRFGHPFQDRPISVREAACLQTFPRDFIFKGSMKSTTRQVGNAVPVTLAEKMGTAFIKQYERARTKGRRPAAITGDG